MNIHLRHEARQHPVAIAQLAVDLHRAAAAVGKMVTADNGRHLLKSTTLDTLHRIEHRLSVAPVTLEGPLLLAGGRDAEYRFLDTLERAEVALEATKEQRCES